MADNINVPPPVQTAQGTAAQTGTNPPANTVVTGFVVNRDASGNPVIRTDNGDITVPTNFFLKIGSEVTVILDASGGNTNANIISVDGQTPQAAESASSYSNEPNVVLSQQFSADANNTEPAASASASATQENEPSAQLGSTVTGTIISQSASVQQESQPPVGSQVVLKIVSLNAPDNNAAPEVAVSANEPANAEAQNNSSNATTQGYATYARASYVPPAAPAVSAALETEPAATSATQVNSSAPVAPSTVVVQAAAGTIQPASAQTAAQSSARAVVQNTVQAQISSSVLPTAVKPVEPGSGMHQTVTNQNGQAAAQENAGAEESETVEPGQIITARIIGNEPTGEALIQTPAGVVRLQPGTVVPSGSKITFEVVQTTPPDLTNNAGISISGLMTDPAPITQLAQQWTALQQIFKLLAGRATNTGLDALPSTSAEEESAGSGQESTSLAISSATITSGLMPFISALRSGDIKQWLGKENVKWLEDQGHTDLLKRVDGELQSLAKQFTTPTEHHWQSLFFPVSVDGNLQQVRMFVKRDRKQPTTKESGKNDDIRFVIEVDLTKLGELQMDGFVRRVENEMNFDMMIRSLTPLSQEIQNDILLIYTETGALTGYKGSLQFQSVKEFPVNPMQEIVAGMNVLSA